MTKFLLLLLPFLSCFPAFAQEDGVYYTSRDFSTWTSATFNLKLSKPWSLSLSEEFRFKTNSSELDAFFTELKTSYKFSNGLFFGGGYRFISDRTDKTGESDLEQRFQIDFGYSFKVKRFEFEARLRGQSRDDLGETRAADGDYARRTLRLKLQAEYNIKNWKLDPIFSTEIFRSNGKYVNPSFSKWRTTIETNYSFKKAGDLGAFYRFEKDLNTDYGLNHFIIGVQYKFTFKTYKKNAQKESSFLY
jgi:hypothetical protein